LSADPDHQRQIHPSREIHANTRVEFLEEHPGGAKILKRWSGKNATKAFWKYHNEDVLKKYGKDLKIGAVGESAKL
jgi:cytochrome b involved in lipid metabolism